MGGPQLREEVPLLSPMDWMVLGACRDRSPELFDEFPQVPYLSDFGRIIEAVAVCAGCPVRAECLAFGIVHKTSGVHGGHVLVAGSPITRASMERRLLAARRREAQLQTRRQHRHVA